MTTEAERKSARERQQRMRDRREANGLAEVRGIYAPPDDHDAIRHMVSQARKTRRGADPKS